MRRWSRRVSRLRLPLAPQLTPARHTPPLQTDRRALNITLNSIGTELTRDDRKKLYSNFGLLYPHGHNELSMAEDFDQIRAAMEKVPAYASIFNKVRCGCCCSTRVEGLCACMHEVEASRAGRGVHCRLVGQCWELVGDVGSVDL